MEENTAEKEEGKKYGPRRKSVREKYEEEKQKMKGREIKVERNVKRDLK